MGPITIASINWEAVGSIATVISTLAVLVALIYGIRQLREDRRSRVITVFLPLYESLQSEVSVTRRRRLYNEISADLSQISVDDEGVMNAIINQMDFLGFLAEEELLEFEIIAPFFYGTAIRCWLRLEPYIQEQRRLRKTKFATYFETLAEKCRQYLVTRRPEEEIAVFASPRKKP